MAICFTQNIALYKIDVKTGQLTELMKFQADFNEEVPYLNTCVISADSTLLCTGGDDSIIRLWTLAKD